MPIAHILLALLVVSIWGVNFVFVKLSLNEISPLLLLAVRFLLASVPAVLFIKRPAMPFKTLALYGLFMFVMQFTFVFFGIRIGMTPGMASLIMQVQVFFSMFLAAFLLSEVPSIWQIVGALVSFTGIGLVAMHFDNNISLPGFLLILAAAAAWGIGNLITRKNNHVNMISLVIWANFIAFFPMLILTFVFEGTSNIVYSYHHITWLGITAVLYIVFASTWIGYGIWNWLLSRHPVGMVVPFTVLIPIVGIMSSVFILGESFQLWKLFSGLLVISGLCINILGTRFFMPKISLIKNLQPEKQQS